MSTKTEESMVEIAYDDTAPERLSIRAQPFCASHIFFRAGTIVTCKEGKNRVFTCEILDMNTGNQQEWSGICPEDDAKRMIDLIIKTFPFLEHHEKTTK